MVKDSCTGNSAEDEISCFCSHNNVSAHFDLRHVLPLTLPSLAVRSSKSDVSIEAATANAELAITLNSEKRQLSLLFDSFECALTATDVHGCYNYITHYITLHYNYKHNNLYG
ncbi:unnamed protein product [Nippostrongylus brasiliensis]|uniref:Phlebovirus_G2 domain-containing protein n=1 Tax=Nippostrongylus brasiliensis TaxID=27835 RepID=A0A0N4YBE2_NIPBR|nr:unnamed protein product [Nippostrongylus brasiliensis]